MNNDDKTIIPLHGGSIAIGLNQESKNLPYCNSKCVNIDVDPSKRTIE